MSYNDRLSPPVVVTKRGHKNTNSPILRSYLNSSNLRVSQLTSSPIRSSLNLNSRKIPESDKNEEESLASESHLSLASNSTSDLLKDMISRNRSSGDSPSSISDSPASRRKVVFADESQKNDVSAAKALTRSALPTVPTTKVTTGSFPPPSGITHISSELSPKSVQSGRFMDGQEALEQGRLHFFLFAIAAVVVLTIGVFYDGMLAKAYHGNSAIYSEMSLGFMNPFVTETLRYGSNYQLNDQKFREEILSNQFPNEKFISIFAAPNYVYGYGLPDQNHSTEREVPAIFPATIDDGSAHSQRFIQALLDLRILTPINHDVIDQTSSSLKFECFGFALKPIQVFEDVVLDTNQEFYQKLNHRKVQIKIMVDNTLLNLPRDVFDIQLDNRIEMSLDLATYNISMGAHEVRVALLLVCNPKYDSHGYQYLTVSSDVVFYYFPLNQVSSSRQDHNIGDTSTASTDRLGIADFAYDARTRESVLPQQIVPKDVPFTSISPRDFESPSRNDKLLSVGLDSMLTSMQSSSESQAKVHQMRETNKGTAEVAATTNSIHTLGSPTKPIDLEEVYVSPFEFLGSHMNNGVESSEYKNEKIIVPIKIIEPYANSENFLHVVNEKTVVKISIPTKYLESIYLVVELFFDGQKYILTDVMREQEANNFGADAITAKAMIDLTTVTSEEDLSKRREFTIDLDGITVGEHRVGIKLYTLNSNDEIAELGQDFVRFLRRA